MNLSKAIDLSQFLGSFGVLHSDHEEDSDDVARSERVFETVCVTVANAV